VARRHLLDARAATATFHIMPRLTVDRLARILMYGGAIVALLGVGAWVLDVIPPMPEWMVRLAIYKLTLAGGAGLIAVGALLRRAARESAIRRGDTGEHALAAGEADLTRSGESARQASRVPR
jgi:hypothetical protein